MAITDLVRFPNSFASESYTASHNYKHNHNHSQRLHKLRSLWSQGNYLFLFLYCIQDNPRESKTIQENFMLSFKTTYQSTNLPSRSDNICFVDASMLCEIFVKQEKNSDFANNWCQYNHDVYFLFGTEID